MESLKSKEWWSDVLTRAIKTVAQTALGSGIGTAMLLSEVNWAVVGSASLLAGIASILMSLATIPLKNEEE